jgi:hypothetical protein
MGYHGKSWVVKAKWLEKLKLCYAFPVLFQLFEEFGPPAGWHTMSQPNVAGICAGKKLHKNCVRRPVSRVLSARFRAG